MINKTDAQVQVELEDALDIAGEDLDSADVFAAISHIADEADIDLIEVLDLMLRGGNWKWGWESVIQSILESSQSNLDASLLSLRWMTVLDRKIADL